MRLPTLTYEQLTPRQKETWNKHAERRDKPVGPYLTWLHSPDLMDKVSPLSNYFRFDCVDGSSLDLGPRSTVWPAG